MSKSPAIPKEEDCRKMILAGEPVLILLEKEHHYVFMYPGTQSIGLQEKETFKEIPQKVRTNQKWVWQWECPECGHLNQDHNNRSSVECGECDCSFEVENEED